MPRLTTAFAAIAACALTATPALADDVEEIRVALPETVELAELQPGLQVITRLDLEVFSVDGALWLKSGGRWHTSRRPLEGFQAVEPRGVPPALAQLEPGRYLEYRPAQGQRVTQRRLGAEPAPAPAPGGVQVDAGPARLVPRADPPAAAPAPPPVADGPRPAAAATKAKAGLPAPAPTPAKARVAPPAPPPAPVKAKAKAPPPAPVNAKAKVAPPAPAKAAPPAKKPPAKPAANPLPRKTLPAKE
jgi:hypothetical protein